MTSIFTHIINRTLPGHIVYEDEQCYVIMTIQPFTTGHVLVIPRAEIDHWDDLPDELAIHMLQVSRKMAKILKQVFGSARAGVLVAGVDLPHVHIHVFPANTAADFDMGAPKPVATDEALAAAAAAIRAAL